jgi:hypothetical protein
MNFAKATTALLIVSLGCWPAAAGFADEPPSAVPRSDGQVLHVDFENYVDGVVQALNAGVRWLGDPFTNFNQGRVEITTGGAFAGRRAALVATSSRDQIARVRLQSRFDAPRIDDDTVVEFVFRAGDKEELEDLLVWSASSSEGHPVGLIVQAQSSPGGDVRFDVTHARAVGSPDRRRTLGVFKSAPAEWIRVIQHRRRRDGVVELWAGAPGAEKRVGVYPDLGSNAQVAKVELGDTSQESIRGSGYWDDVRVGRLQTGAGDLAPGEPRLRDVGRERAEIKLPIRVGRARQLFVDDAAIESRSGVQRTFHPVRKFAHNPLIVRDKPWEGHSVLVYGAVIRDPESGKLRMWYLAWGKQLGRPSFVCLAESTDGIHWEKPALGLHEFEGSTKNNIVLPGWSQLSVAYDPTDSDPARRYKMLMRKDGTRGFVSPDGLHWTDVGVLLEQAYDSTTMHWDPVGHKWVAMVKIFKDGKRARGYAESRDFLHWSDTYFMDTVDERDPDGDQMYAMSMFHYETVYLGLLRMYHTTSDVVDVQLAVSRNAKRWARPTREPFLPTGPKGAWDFGNNSVTSTPPLRVGDELWFYYGGRSTLHNEVPNDGAIGLAMLRVDGFASIDSPGRGTLTTRPLLLDGSQLYLNADAEGGSIRVEVLDADGQVIPAFARDGAEAILGDAVRQRVVWKGNPPLPDQTVRLRFHVDGAALYAFWVE